jgi:hypothetical protein
MLHPSRGGRGRPHEGHAQAFRELQRSHLAARGGNKTLVPDDGYMYDVEQCDVPAERRSALRRFRERRRLWLSWLHTDEVHPIWPTLHTMVWTERCLQNSDGFHEQRRERA